MAYFGKEGGLFCPASLPRNALHMNYSNQFSKRALFFISSQGRREEYVTCTNGSMTDMYMYRSHLNTEFNSHHAHAHICATHTQMPHTRTHTYTDTCVQSHAHTHMHTYTLTHTHYLLIPVPHRELQCPFPISTAQFLCLYLECRPPGEQQTMKYKRTLRQGLVAYAAMT